MVVDKTADEIAHLKWALRTLLQRKEKPTPAMLELIQYYERQLAKHGINPREGGQC